MRKKVYLILSLVTVFALGIWAVSPAMYVAAQPAQQQTSACEQAASQLVGRLAELPRIIELINETCDFRVRLNWIPADVSEFDRLYIESVIATKMLELQSLEIALQGATDEEWRGLINMMIIMHTSDLEMALAVAEKIGAQTEPDLTQFNVYPETPDYDLSIRTINLLERFLNPLTSLQPGTPTAIPSGTVTGVPPTDIGTGTPTGLPTETATSHPMDTPTSTPTAFQIDTATATGTGTPIDTVTTTVTATETETALPTDTATGTATDTPAALPTNTATDTPAGTATTDLTGTPTGTLTMTPIGTTTTPGPGGVTTFELLAIDIIEDEHVMSIETALVAQRLAENDEIRAFAKHSADVAQLHLILMNDLEYRLAYNITLPTPSFEANYQSPRRFSPDNLP
jgi:hypothetical protein